MSTLVAVFGAGPNAVHYLRFMRRLVRPSGARAYAARKSGAKVATLEFFVPLTCDYIHVITAREAGPECNRRR